MCNKHERLLNCEVGQQPVILSDVRRTTPDHVAGPGYVVEIHVPGDQPAFSSAGNDIKQCCLTTTCDRFGIVNFGVNFGLT